MKNSFYHLLFFLSIHLITYAQTNEQVQVFSLQDVRLLDSPFYDAQQTDLAYILAMQPDRLLAPYLREAGLTPKAESYTNWENTGLDGHIGGHYLSALAMMYASTANEVVKNRLDYMIEELDRCQRNVGTGFLGGTPGSLQLWNEIRQGEIRAGKFSLNSKWVPLYNIHKTFAGLKDAYLYADNQLALQMLIKLADWMWNVSSGLTEEQMQNMLVSEHGGLNEVFADLYAITQDSKYLSMAQRFSHQAILQPLLHREDKLTGLHANTQIPKVIGYKRIADLTQNKPWGDAAAFFWETVVDHRTVSIGGNSVRENFHAHDNFHRMVTSNQGNETCNTYNMLRLSKMLYQSSANTQYLDYYERALYNHILSTQEPDRGGFVYFTPMRPGHYRVYSQPETSMWCCVGSGLENHAKYGELIYAHTANSLLVNLYIPSELNWVENGLKLKQLSKFPDKDTIHFEIAKSGLKKYKIGFRKPDWIKNYQDIQFIVNGKKMEIPTPENGYVYFNRKWKSKDKISLILPMEIEAEQLPDKSDYYSFRYGPIVLGAELGTYDLKGLYADDSRMGHAADGSMMSLEDSPNLLGRIDDIINSIVKVDGDQLHFRYKGKVIPDTKAFDLKPFFRIHNTRYAVYFHQIPQDQINKTEMLEADKKLEALDKQTIDLVYCGEQQPESDHFIQMENANTGYTAENHWREADGWFSYKLQNKEQKTAYLYIAYLDQAKSRQVEISVNGEKIISLELKGGKGEQLFEAVYPIPENLQSEAVLTVRFDAKDGKRTVQLSQVRLLEAIPESYFSAN